MKDRLQILLLPVLILFFSPILLAQEFGIASVYQDKFHGKTTAYGRVYDKNARVAAHKKYPLGTLLKVTHLENKKTVVVEVIDQGPFIKGRIIDLSRRAAADLDMLAEGVTRVKVEYAGNKQPSLSNASQASNTPSSLPPPDREIPSNFDDTGSNRIVTPPPPTTNTRPETSPAEPIAKTERETLTPKGSEVEKTPPKKAVPETETSSSKVLRKDFTQYGLYKILLKKPEQSKYGVQIGYFSSYESLLKQVANLQAKWFDKILVDIEKAENGASGFKVILGATNVQKDATAYKNSLSRKHKINGFVVEIPADSQTSSLYEIQLEKPSPSTYGVQVAYLTSEEGMLKQLQDLQAKWFDKILLSIEKGANDATGYKIMLGPFDTEAQAVNYRRSLSSKHRIKGFVVDLKTIEY